MITSEQLEGFESLLGTGAQPREEFLREMCKAIRTLWSEREVSERRLAEETKRCAKIAASFYGGGRIATAILQRKKPAKSMKENSSHDTK